MHPRTREVRKPDSGIDPRGSGSGQPPLLQGFLKHRRPAPAPLAASAAEAPAAGAPAAGAPAAEQAAPEETPAAEPAGAPTRTPAKPRKRTPNAES